MRDRLLSTSHALANWVHATERTWHRQLAGLLFLLGIGAYLAVRLDRIGWASLWEARPTEPAFYLLVLLAYLVLPVADTLIYRRLWDIEFWPSLGTFMRKRIYNSAFIGYSGEIFLMVWARRRIEQSDSQIAHDIKDTNILSAAVSTYVSAGLILYALTHAAFHSLTAGEFQYWSIATLLIAGLAPVALLFRKYFMRLPARTALIVMAIHSARFFVGQLLILWQWQIVMPDVGWNNLVTLLAVQILVGRIPLLPNRDLIFISIGIALSGKLAMSPAMVAGLLITTSALQQMFHLVVFLWTSLQRPGHKGFISQ